MESEEFPFGHAELEMYVRPLSGNAKYRAITSVKSRGEVWARQKYQGSVPVAVLFKGVGMPQTTQGEGADGREDGWTIQRSGM